MTGVISAVHLSHLGYATRQIGEFPHELESENGDTVYYTEARWLSKGKVQLHFQHYKNTKRFPYKPRQAMYVYRNIEAHSRNHCCCGKAISITYWCVCACLCVRAYIGYPGAWVCVCAYVHIALLIKHTTRMRHIVTSFVAPRYPLDFSTLSHKQCDFRKKVTEFK